MDIFFDAGDTFVLAQWLFLRLLGLIYFVAFTSFGVQALGLIGENGILPARNYLKRVKETLGKRGYLTFPTLLWINASDRAIIAICLSGSLFGLLLLFGLQTTWILAFLWAGYLSLIIAARTFLSYQWDVLLVESGFLAIFLIPPSLLPAQAVGLPSQIIVFLFIWLLFRLIFQSGIMKLASGDPTWREQTAMSFHYETQPLPTPLAWYMHKAPIAFQKTSTVFAMFVEIIVPLLFYRPIYLG